MRRAVFPGSFDPLTVAHVAIADAVHEQAAVDEVHLVISVAPLAKAAEVQAPVAARIAAIERFTAGRPWLRGGVTEAQLIADIAAGFDVVVLGADKWAQIQDQRFYPDLAARDAALGRLPTVAVAPRQGFDLPDNCLALDLPPGTDVISSTAVRAGREDWAAEPETPTAG